MQSVAALVFIMDNRYYHVCMADWHLINFRVNSPLVCVPNLRSK